MADAHQSNLAATDHDPPSTTPRASFPKRAFRPMVALLLLSVVAIVFGQDLIRTTVNKSNTKKQAFGEMHIRYQRPKILYEIAPPETERDFERYKKTQGRLLKGQFVLNAALSQSEVRDTTLLKQQSDPVGWLEEHLEVDFPGDEFMRLSLDAPLSQEAVKIVNAVLNAYLNEVVNKAKKDQQARFRTLEEFHRTIKEELLTKKTGLAELTKILEPAPTQKVEAEYIDQVQNRVTQIKMELVRVVSRLSAVQEAEPPSKNEIELAVNSDPVIARLTADRLVQEELIALSSNQADGERDQNESPLLTDERRHLQAVVGALEKRRSLIEKSIREQLVEAPQKLLQAKVERLNLEQKKFEDELSKLRDTVHVTRNHSFELEELKKEIARNEGTALQFATEIERLQIELHAPQRITLVNQAQYP